MRNRRTNEVSRIVGLAALLSAGWLGSVWLAIAGDSAWRVVPRALVLPLVAAAGLRWQWSRVRARRRVRRALAADAERMRLQRALDAFADREMARVDDVRRLALRSARLAFEGRNGQ